MLDRIDSKVPGEHRVLEKAFTDLEKAGRGSFGSRVFKALGNGISKVKQFFDQIGNNIKSLFRRSARQVTAPERGLANATLDPSSKEESKVAKEMAEQYSHPYKNKEGITIDNVQATFKKHAIASNFKTLFKDLNGFSVRELRNTIKKQILRKGNSVTPDECQAIIEKEVKKLINFFGPVNKGKTGSEFNKAVQKKIDEMAPKQILDKELVKEPKVEGSITEQMKKDMSRSTFIIEGKRFPRGASDKIKESLKSFCSKGGKFEPHILKTLSSVAHQGLLEPIINTLTETNLGPFKGMPMEGPNKEKVFEISKNRDGDISITITSRAYITALADFSTGKAEECDSTESHFKYSFSVLLKAADIKKGTPRAVLQGPIHYDFSFKPKN